MAARFWLVLDADYELASTAEHKTLASAEAFAKSSAEVDGAPRYVVEVISRWAVRPEAQREPLTPPVANAEDRRYWGAINRHNEGCKIMGLTE